MNPIVSNRSPRDTRVVVAMSGGVDSSVAAAMLAEQGYDVVGITLQLYDHGAAVKRKNACCAGQDIHDARRVAARLGVPHYVLDYESRFRDQVIDDFIDSYVVGETPIPCVRCNQTVKFTDLLATARDLGAEALATGHYARRVDGTVGVELHRAVDLARDQSYFLFATTRDQVEFLRFPLGDLTKAETRDLAARYDLPVAAKPDSQDVCFVPNGGYADLVAKLRPGSIEPGDIVDLDGTVIGRHDGVINFTVGQRRGLNVGGTAEPLYVVRIDPENHRIVAGPRSALAVEEIVVDSVNWLGPTELGGETHSVNVKIRSQMAPVEATVTGLSGARARIAFRHPQYGVSPGQAGVFYDGSRILGGGWIARGPAALLAKPGALAASPSVGIASR
ncbi:MAG: tRNA 2-thiouridine(34) synthase MnmA [Alphaproteobacteria bacterium]|nr:tRNA 2-thiouridine(34) synthase MnmA [Alphaproteobacteria bacterium]